MTAEQHLDVWRRIARQRLESLARAGVDFVPKAKHPPVPLSAFAPAAAAIPAPPPTITEEPMPVKKSAAVSAPPVSKPVTPPAKSAVPLGGDRLAALHIIKEKTLDCTRCTAFSGRTQAVFGVGNVHARVVFFGEAPGADEDRLGEPFVGKAGQLLNKIIEACTFKREDVYIMNVCKCRPPENRTPLEDEIENCREFFEAQFEVLEPEYIVCLGATAVKALFGKSAAIGKLRGKLHDWRGSKVLATYHPAYLLRNPEAKKDVWADMQILLRDMGITLPAKSS